MSKPRIAVIGGGPGGLTLARVLHVNGVDASVFEREGSVVERTQGGSLDMHPDAGQLAIESAGLTREFKLVARYEDQEGRFYDQHGNLVLVDDDVAGKNRPEVDRGQLRQMLLNSLPPQCLHWGRELSVVLPRDDASLEVEFKGGESERFDLVVGADGAWSRVRRLVSDAQPAYSGVTFVELGIDDVDVRLPDVSRLIGRGLTFAVGDRKAIIGHRDANAHLSIYAALRVPKDWIEQGGLDLSSPDAARSSLATHYGGWSRNLLDLIMRSGDSITPRGIYALPVGHSWANRSGVTLLGDAAHLMSPFGGHGANLAMRDATDLALAIASNEDWRGAVQRYESAMFRRAEQAAEKARCALDQVFSEGGAARTLVHLQDQQVARIRR